MSASLEDYIFQGAEALGFVVVYFIISIILGGAAGITLVVFGVLPDTDASIKLAIRWTAVIVALTPAIGYVRYHRSWQHIGAWLK